MGGLLVLSSYLHGMSRAHRYRSLYGIAGLRYWFAAIVLRTLVQVQ